MELKINRMVRHFDEDNLDCYVDESIPYTIVQMGNDKYLVTFDKIKEEPKKEMSEDAIHEYYTKCCTSNLIVNSMLDNVALKLYNAFKDKFATNYVTDLIFQTRNTTEKFNKVIAMIGSIEPETKEDAELRMRMSCYVEESFVSKQLDDIYMTLVNKFGTKLNEEEKTRYLFTSESEEKGNGLIKLINTIDVKPEETGIPALGVCKMLDDIFGALCRRFQNELNNDAVEEYPPTFGDYEGKFRAILKMIRMRKTKEPSDFDVKFRTPYSDEVDPLITFLKHLETMHGDEKQDKTDKSKEPKKEEDKREEISLLDAIKLAIDDIKCMDDDELVKLFGVPPEFLGLR